MKKDGNVFHFLKNEALIYQSWLDKAKDTEKMDEKKLPGGLYEIAKNILGYNPGAPYIKKFFEMGLIYKDAAGNYIIRVCEYKIISATTRAKIVEKKENAADDLLQKSQSGRIKTKEELEAEIAALKAEVEERNEKINNIEKVLENYEIIAQIICVKEE